MAKAAQSQAERQAEKESEDGAGMKNHPVIRTMYDHEMVNNPYIPPCYSLTFHVCCYVNNSCAGGAAKADSLPFENEGDHSMVENPYIPPFTPLPVSMMLCK